MVASVGFGTGPRSDLSELGSSAEFAHRDHQGFVEQAAVRQIFQQRSKGSIEIREQGTLSSGKWSR